MGEPGTKTYWDGFAEGYAQLGPPLTPAPEDAALALAAIAEWSASHPGRAPRAILLGVTPGMAQLQFPANSWLTAIDQSAPMTRWAWPGNVSGQRSVVRGNWLALPFQDRSCDLVLGDAAMNCLRFETISRRWRPKCGEFLSPKAYSSCAALHTRRSRKIPPLWFGNYIAIRAFIILSCA